MDLIVSIIILAALANSLMDVLQFRWSKSIFKRSHFWMWWAGPQSWKRKNMSSNKLIRWLFRNPLVWMTDGWHFAQTIMFTAYQSGLIWMTDLPDLGYVPWAQFLTYLIGAKIIHGLVFELFYNKIFTT